MTITAANAFGEKCIIVASQAGNANYNAATDVTRDFTIAKATLTVNTANKERFYGDANPELTGSIDGIKNNDAITATYSTPATLTSNVGNYPITATLNDPDDKLGNYDVTNNGGTLTVKKAPLSVTANSRDKVYGELNPTLTGTLTGVVNNDNITANYTTQATQFSLAGPYDITATLSSDPASKLGNYNVTNNKGTLTILSLSTKGFFQPVDMSGTTIAWNTVKGGSTVPVKLELFKNVNDPSTELRDTTYVKQFMFNKVTCTAGVDDAIEELTTATGQTTLRYDTTGDQFVYNWATPKATSTTCYKLTMYSADGASQISAYFKLNK